MVHAKDGHYRGGSKPSQVPRRILGLLKDGCCLTRTDLQEAIGCCGNTIYNNLRKLLSAKLILKIGNDGMHSFKYRITELGLQELKEGKVKV